MNARLALGVVASIGLALTGCDNSQPRTFHGQINVSDYGLHQPVVMVESSNKLSYVANVSAAGKFTVAVPAGQSYRLTLADRTAAGPLALVSRILWSAKGQNFVWAKVAKGSTINFGVIRPVGASGANPSTTGASVGSQGQNSNGQGENDDSQCDEDDDAQGDEQGPAGSSGTCQPPMQPPSNPPLCMPGSMGDSQGDHDEDCDHDDHDYGDDDRDGSGGSAAQCRDGGTMSSGDDDNQGNDNAQGNENEDDGDGDDGNGCVKHVPKCPPAGSGGGMAAPDMGTPPPPPPPSGSPDMSTTGGPIP
jgi:hypothetical protein